MYVYIKNLYTCLMCKKDKVEKYVSEIIEQKPKIFKHNNPDYNTPKNFTMERSDRS